MTEAAGAWHCVLQGRVRTLALSESSREDVISSVKDFLHPKAYYQVTQLMNPTIRHAGHYQILLKLILSMHDLDLLRRS